MKTAEELLQDYVDNPNTKFTEEEQQRMDAYLFAVDRMDYQGEFNQSAIKSLNEGR